MSNDWQDTHQQQIALAERALEIQAATGCTPTEAYRAACAEAGAR
jgi:UDP-N-acetylglucosamine transferase subunit ALG13